MAKKINQPSLEDEKELNDVLEDNKEEFEALGRKWKIGYLRNGTKRKVTSILMNEKDEDKVSTKCAAALLLNGYFKILFLYPILWRWFYYIKQYGEEDLTSVIGFCKKKMGAESYLINTILLTEMRDTIMTMTRTEVNRFLQERRGEQHGVSEKNTDPSQNP